MTPARARVATLLLLALTATAVLAGGVPSRAAAPAQEPDWVAASNRHAQLLLDVFARFSPEGAGQLGVEGLDEQISDISAPALERQRQAMATARKDLQGLLAREPHPLVRQDLQILIDSASEAVRGAELAEEHLVPYTDVTRLVYGGLRALLDEQVAPARRAAALVRLRKYAGLTGGFEPVAAVAERRTRDRLGRKGLLPPARQQVERDLTNAPILREGIARLLEQYQIGGWQEPYEALRTQLEAYERFVRDDVLPGARTDFRLPPELYRFALDQFGVDQSPEDVAAAARAAFTALQSAMQKLAPRVARSQRLRDTDYRAVIRALKKDQLVGDRILPHYRRRLEQIEAIIRRQQLVTLPAREARIRIATDAEAASNPAPNMRPPRLIGNTGEFGEFILPLNIPAPADSQARAQQYDDFTYEAASWTLTAHEARPGHEMQFAKMIEAGVSAARAIFAFNSTNVEGWGLYAEWMIFPHMPPDGQLVSLQFRLLRAARAFLDPELHLGRVTPEEARRILREDVVLSEAMTEQEVERYMFRAPGQATSYFYGYTRLQDIRADAERAMAGRFNAREFHDFVLAQGLLPPALLREAVMTRFTPRNASP